MFSIRKNTTQFFSDPDVPLWVWGFFVASLSLLLTSAAAWITHVIVCIKASAWVLLAFGCIVAPVGVVHGFGVWLGVLE